MKRLTRWLLIALVLMLCAVDVFAADASVTKMDVNCVVDRYGGSTTTVTAEVAFDTASAEIWIPVGTDVRSVSLSGYRVSKKTVDGSVWLVLKNSEGAAGTKTFVLTFKQPRNVTRNADKTQTFDLQLVCPLWTWEVQELTFSVTMPKEFDAKTSYLSGYYADAVHVEDTVEGQIIRGSVPGGLLDRESIDLIMTLPQGYFRLRNLKGGTATADVVLIGVLALLCLLYWFRTLRNPLPKQQDRRLAPDGVFAWEFPYVGGSGAPDPALLVTEWACLGYLTVSVTARGRVNLRARIPMSNERKPYEQKAFAALFRKGAVCAGDTPRFRKIGVKAARACRSYWNCRLFSRDSGNPKLLEAGAAAIFALTWFRAIDLLLPVWTLRVLLMIPVLLLGFPAGQIVQQSIRDAFRRTPGRRLLPVLLVLLATALLSQFGGGWPMTLLALLIQTLAAAGTYYGGQRSHDGMERVAQIRAFRRYLRTVNIHHLQLMLNQDNQYFYDILPYAEALGMGRRFARRFAHIQLEPCVWLEDRTYHGGTAMDFYRRYRKLLKKMRGVSGIRL